ncbi:MAG: hypothetical protein HRT61_18870 [Ekhidna sp.]|nr:hypothetical protein [Ekhidna sp.]
MLRGECVLLRIGLLILLLLSSSISKGQLHSSSDAIGPVGIYEGRAKPYEEGMIFLSDDPQSLSEHQNLLSLGWIKGTLVYDGRIFHEVDMNYNVFEDILLLLSLRMNTKHVKALKTDQKKIDEFVIGDRVFVNHAEIKGAPKPSGFYEILFDGQHIDAFAKHGKWKMIQKDGVKYMEQKQVFLRDDNRFHEIKSITSLYRLYPSLKKELKLHVNRNGKRFTKRKTSDLPEILGYCDQLLGNER